MTKQCPIPLCPFIYCVANGNVSKTEAQDTPNTELLGYNLKKKKKKSQSLLKRKDLSRKERTTVSYAYQVGLAVLTRHAC